MAVVLGFDFGTRRIGVALGQAVTATATPLITLRNRGGQPDWAALARIVAEWQPSAAVVGLPVHMDEREAELAGQVRWFAAELQQRFNLAVHLIDERLTTHAALACGAAKQRVGVDAVAAQLILETWLSERYASVERP